MHSLSSWTNTTAVPPAPVLLADRAYVELRDRIITLSIPPGAPIDEEQLSEQLKMGRTPIREAIKRLALENLVLVFPRRGTFASEINITDLNHISEVRIVLEALAAQRAAERFTASRRSELDELLAALERARGSDNPETLITVDAAIHRFIYRCASNPYLEESLNHYFNLSLRIWHLVINRLPQGLSPVHKHEQVLRAIAAGDGERASELMREHVSTFERDVRAVL